MQSVALSITLVLVALLAVAFLIVVSRASERVAFEEVTPGGYRLRNNLFRLLLLGGVAVAAISLPRAFLPIKAWAYDDDVQRVHAVGYQWYWELDVDEVELGRPVEFIVSSVDVTHGFGLYDDQLNLLAQTQVMPGYPNRLNITFEKPGTYQILCLEYCGLAHHDMVGEISVVASQNAGEGR